MRNGLKRKRESGQAVVEYVLILAIVVSFVSILGVGFRRSILTVWGFFVVKVSAACPTGCPPAPGVRNLR